jgi:hypothetical protein
VGELPDHLIDVTAAVPDDAATHVSDETSAVTREACFYSARVFDLAQSTRGKVSQLFALVAHLREPTYRDPNAVVMACEVSRPTRTTLLRRKPNFALFKSPLPSRLPRRRVLRRLFPN